MEKHFCQTCGKLYNPMFTDMVGFCSMDCYRVMIRWESEYSDDG